MAARRSRRPPRLTRREGWESRLSDTIEAAARRPFSWGEHDCVLFAADCILAMTGTDLARAVRGAYGTDDAAFAILKRRGGLSRLADRLARSYGCREIQPNYGQRGDICVVRGTTPEGTGTLALGVITSDGTIAVPGPAGLSFLRRGAALRCYTSG